MKKRLILICLVFVIIFSVMGAITIQQNLKQRKLWKLRISDVKNLSQLHRDLIISGTNAVENIETLLRNAEKAGITLNNPIPEDPTKPCYRLAFANVNDDSQFLIEETNVTDKRYIVRSRSDGSVVVMNKNQ